MLLLCSYRPKWEGGQYEGDENERLDVLRLAMELGADYIDVELQVIIVVFDANYHMVFLLLIILLVF